MIRHGTWLPRSMPTNSMTAIQLLTRKMKKVKKQILYWSKLRLTALIEWLIDCLKMIQKIQWNLKFFKILIKSGKILKLKLQKKQKFIRNQLRIFTKSKRTVLNFVWKLWKKKSLNPRKKASHSLASSRVTKSTSFVN